MRLWWTEHTLNSYILFETPNGDSCERERREWDCNIKMHFMQISFKDDC
jgi:hypothetical protein